MGCFRVCVCFSSLSIIVLGKMSMFVFFLWGSLFAQVVLRQSLKDRKIT